MQVIILYYWNLITPAFNKVHTTKENAKEERNGLEEDRTEQSKIKRK